MSRSNWGAMVVADQAIAPLNSTVLSEDALGYAAAAHAVATQRAYSSDLATFKKWCELRGVSALPCTGTTLANYCTERAAAGSKLASILRSASAINRAHKAAHLPQPRSTPESMIVLRGIRNRHGGRPRKMDPLSIEDIRAMIASHRIGGLAAARDKALLLVGFAGGFRRSELAAIRIEDINIGPRGLAILLPRSKTDQTGKGRTVPIKWGKTDLCPIKALQAWLLASGIRDGRIFRGVRKGKMSSRPMAGQTVERIVKRLAHYAGLDVPAGEGQRARIFAGHSLRAGVVTSQAARGASDRSIQAITGHKSREMIDEYVRNETVFDGASDLGL